MKSATKIAVILLCLAILAVPTCLLLRGPADRNTVTQTPPAKPSQPAPESMPMAPEDIPAGPAEPTGPLAALSQLVDRVMPAKATTAQSGASTESDEDDPRDPIGTTIRSMHRYLRATPDALAERPAVKRPGVVYWMESNLIASDP
jgi:hypothetical protein